jgi:hypothetical protein
LGGHGGIIQSSIIGLGLPTDPIELPLEVVLEELVDVCPDGNVATRRGNLVPFEEVAIVGCKLLLPIGAVDEASPVLAGVVSGNPIDGSRPRALSRNLALPTSSIELVVIA